MRGGPARQRICIVGGGVWLRPLCEALITRPHPPMEIHLCARRADRLRLIAEDLSAFVAGRGGDLPIVAHSDLEEAAAGADFVVLLLRAGGLRARAADEALAQRFGHVGDEGLALGGAANAWRTAPILSEIASILRRCAPDAWILNMVAPLGITTRLLLGAGLRAVGICELPTVTAERLGCRVAGPGPTGGSGAPVRYAGLNHLGWFWAEGEVGARALAAAADAGQVEARTLARFGAAPLHYYYEVVDVDAGQRLGRRRAPGRGDALAEVAEAAFRALAERPGEEVLASDQRSTPWFERALVPVMVALAGGAPLWTSVNVLNREAGGALIPWLPPDAVVELFATVTARGIEAGAVPRPPAAVVAFLGALAEYEDALYQAVSQRDEARLAQALAIGPWALAAVQARLAAASMTHPSASTNAASSAE